MTAEMRCINTELLNQQLTEEDRVMLRWLTLGLMPGLVSLLGLGVWFIRRGRR